MIIFNWHAVRLSLGNVWPWHFYSKVTRNIFQLASQTLWNTRSSFINFSASVKFERQAVNKFSKVPESSANREILKKVQTSLKWRYLWILHLDFTYIQTALRYRIQRTSDKAHCRFMNILSDKKSSAGITVAHLTYSYVLIDNTDIY